MRINAKHDVDANKEANNSSTESSQMYKHLISNSTDNNIQRKKTKSINTQFVKSNNNIQLTVVFNKRLNLCWS